MKFNVIVDDANLDESPHVPGIYKPTDRVHFADAGPDIMEEAKLPADRLLAEQFGLYPDPADDLRKELFETRAAVAGGRASLADIELELESAPPGSDPATLRSWEHYRRRSRAELALNEQKLDGLVAGLRGFGEIHTIE